MLLENYANRVRFARSLTKLSREAFEKKYGINQNTLKSWELGINSLTEKSATQIANAIKNEGFTCSPEWLIFGMGQEPRLLKTDDALLNEMAQYSKLIYEAEYFKKNNENSTISMITDLSMSPIYQVGDYVGGIFEENISEIKKLDKFINKNCIILIKDIQVIRKIIMSNNSLILLYPINNEFKTDIVNITDIKAIAYIIWHRTNI